VRYRWLGLILLIFLLLDVCLLVRWWNGRRPGQFEAEIMRASGKYEVDPALVKAIVWRESSFKPQSRGRVGEIGLMQIRALAAGEWAEAEKLKHFDHEQMLDPGTNIMAGSWYISKLLTRYAHTDNPLPYALADYNAGRTHVLRWIKDEARTNSAAFLDQIDFPGTRHYILTVTEKYEEYKQEVPRGRKRK
jgi:soluble lytic murein transglycosylase